MRNIHYHKRLLVRKNHYILLFYDKIKRWDGRKPGAHEKRAAFFVGTRAHAAKSYNNRVGLRPSRFIGCGHFVETNRILAECGETPIQW